MSHRNDLADWAMTVNLAKECCESAQVNGANVVGKAVLQITRQLLDQAMDKENRFLFLSFAPLAVGTIGGLNPLISGFRTMPRTPPPSIFGPAILLAVGLELGNVYGRTVLLNAYSDMTDAIIKTMEIAEAEIRKPGTKRATKKGIFDCNKCVREKSLSQHGHRLAPE
jgi:hypothetical protein